MLALGTQLGQVSGIPGQLEAPSREERDGVDAGPVVFIDPPALTLGESQAAVWVYFGRPGSDGRADANNSVADAPTGSAASGLQLRQPEGDRVDDGTPRDLSEGGGSMARFRAGYTEHGGPKEYLQHLIEVVIPCEYGWGEYVKVNYYESRAQFDPGSWASAGGGDPADDYTVGRNVANWIGMIADPGGSGGWGCW